MSSRGSELGVAESDPSYHKSEAISKGDGHGRDPEPRDLTVSIDILTV